MNSSIIRICIVIFVAVPLAAILQAGLLQPLLPMLPTINIVLPLIIAIASIRASIVGAFAAFLAGLLADVAVGLVLGPQAGAAVVVWLMVSLVSNRVFIESKFTLVALAFAAAVLFSFVRLAFTLQFVSSATQSFGSIMGEGLATAVITIIFTPIFRSLLMPRRTENDRDLPARRRGSL